MADRHRQSRQNLGDVCRIDQLMVLLYHIKSALEPVGGMEFDASRRRLRIPDGGRLRWRVKIGAREFDVRDDHYDSRQWLAPEPPGIPGVFSCWAFWGISHMFGQNQMMTYCTPSEFGGSQQPDLGQKLRSKIHRSVPI